MFLVWTMVFFLQWCFSFLYWLKSPFKVAPKNSKRKSYFPSWIPTKHTKIHTDNLCQCQHTYVRSFLNLFNDFFVRHQKPYPTCTWIHCTNQSNTTGVVLRGPNVENSFKTLHFAFKTTSRERICALLKEN